MLFYQQILKHFVAFTLFLTLCKASSSSSSSDSSVFGSIFDSSSESEERKVVDAYDSRYAPRKSHVNSYEVLDADLSLESRETRLPNTSSEHQRQCQEYTCDVDKEFDAWLKRHGRHLLAKGDRAVQKQKPHFEQTLQRIRAHNERYKAGLESYHLDLNQFAATTYEELKRTTRGLISNDSKPEDLKGCRLPKTEVPQGLDDDSTNSQQDDFARNGLPESFYWRDEEPECVLPIVSQETCANCYAFGGIASLEWHYCLNTGEAMKFSEQTVTDCTFQAKPYNNNGCIGGKAYTIFQYAAEFGTVCELGSDPWEIRADATKCANRRCKHKRFSNLMRRPYYKRIAENDVDTIMNTIHDIGPVMVEMDTPHDFGYYAGGVYSGEAACNVDTRDHALVIVGWGTDEDTKKKYWIVRNSWGADWGESGYIRVERGKDVCGVEMACRYPLMEESDDSKRKRR